VIILHLSDLHFGDKNRFSDLAANEIGKTFCDALKASVRECKKTKDDKIHAVIITGDLVESGLKSQFDIAEKFLVSISTELSIPRNRFIILPGNHDISWAACRAVRAEAENEKFPLSELDQRLSKEKLSNFTQFLAGFYQGPVTETKLAEMNARPLGHGGWLVNFEDLGLSVASLNTSEREHDRIKGGFLSEEQAQNLMDQWKSETMDSFIKIIALHHNPSSTTSANTEWTIEWFRKKEAGKANYEPLSVDAFHQYVSDCAGFEGRERLQMVVKDTSPHLVLHGHHHDQGIPVMWPWAKDGGAPVLSVGSLGLKADQMPSDTPLSCEIIELVLPSEGTSARLVATPLVYDGRFRPSGSVQTGAFRIETKSRAEYNQPLPLPTKFRRELDTIQKPAPPDSSLPPAPPQFYAEPPYIGSHKFVGRSAQLETLSEWASASDLHPVLLYEAIGGSGKSMLTWEWANRHAAKTRNDWAGFFWYSFYEKGATMADFCRKGLSYITSQPRSKFKEKTTSELSSALYHQLKQKPWLLILDGLERVLVSYHRFDAAQVPDDQAGLSDIIAQRNPCAAINPEDEDLLRALTTASPSKLLVTSRLTPSALINRTGQPLPGVLRDRLPGLKPADAEALIRSCGVKGKSEDIQKYLKANCDCHPLVVGVLAGLILDYYPDRGNFDAWQADAINGGGKLNLADLDLVQKRNHILESAISALPTASRHLLSTLALLSESIDYKTLCSLNPDLPPIPEFAAEPKDPRAGPKWEKLSPENQAGEYIAYTEALSRRAAYNREQAEWELALNDAAPFIASTIKDLENRGLLQYDNQAKRYDLHPVVRGMAAGGLEQNEKNQYGQRVVDLFSSQANNPYEHAKELADFDRARHIVKALFQMGKRQEALTFINNNNFISVLSKKFEAHNEILSILRPFFPQNWSDSSLVFKTNGGLLISNIAAVCLRRISAFEEAYLVSENSLRHIIKIDKKFALSSHILNLASTSGELNRLALEDDLLKLAVQASKGATGEPLRSLQLARYRQLSKTGRFDQAQELWDTMKLSDFPLSGKMIATHHYAVNRFLQGCLTETDLLNAETMCQSALGRRNLIGLRGYWHLENDRFNEAKSYLHEAISLAHKAGKSDKRAEIRLLLAKAKLNEFSNQNNEIEILTTNCPDNCHRILAELLTTIGDQENAHLHAKKGYIHAWADGPPHINHFELKQGLKLLRSLSMPLPEVDTLSYSGQTKPPIYHEISDILSSV